MRRQTLRTLEVLFLGLLAWSGVAGAQSWLKAPVPSSGAFKPGSVALQLTDGTILVQQYASSTWWKLTPDKHRNYNTGTWSQLASSIAYNSLGAIVPYAPRFFASAVLPDGRVIVEGGEYEYGSGTTVKWTTEGSIYDPVANVWTPVQAPAGWTKIGDAASIVLANGVFMLSNCCDNPPQAALLNPTTLTWTILTTKSGYAGKYDSNNEEGWTLLPGGNVLTVDADIRVIAPNGPLTNNSEIFNPGQAPADGKWTSAGNTKEPLSFLPCSGGKSTEVGPAVLRPDGTVFATGANTCGGAGHTAIYHPDGSLGYWTAGPNIPCTVVDGTKVCNDMADAPAAVLQDGNVLVQTSPGSDMGNSTFYEFDLKTNKFLTPPIPAPPGFTNANSEVGRMLVVSSGHVFYMRSGEPGEMWFYVPQGTYDPLWQPIVTQVSDNGICVGCITQGDTYIVSGTQLNGLSGGAAFGDDAQSASNYPLVLIENCATGHKFFARTHDFSTMGVATGLFNVVSAQFTVSPATETGPSNLIVIANGIPSLPFGSSQCGTITVQSGGN